MSPPFQSSLQITLVGTFSSLSFWAMARTFSLPKMASFHGANATRGGTRGRPKVAVARSRAAAGVGPSKMWIATGSSTSTRAEDSDSEQREKRASRAVSVVST